MRQRKHNFKYQSSNLPAGRQVISNQAQKLKYQTFYHLDFGFPACRQAGVWNNPPTGRQV